MLPSHHMPQESCTPEQIAAWIASTQSKRLDLQLLCTEPLYNTLRDQAFMQMSDLLKEAIEEVRVVSATLREHSAALLTRTAALREQSQARHDRSTKRSEQRSQDGPSPEERHEAERPLLDRFTGDGNHAVP